MAYWSRLRNRLPGLSLRRLRYLRQALKLVWQSTPGWTIASIGLVVVRGLLPLLLLYLTKLIIDRIADSLEQTLPIAGFNQIAGLMGVAAIAVLLNHAGNSIAAFVNAAQSQAVTDHVHDLLHAQSIQLDLSYYENPQYHDALHQAQQEATYRPASILQHLIQGSQGCVALSGIALLLVSLHWAIALVLFVSVLPGVWLQLRYTRRLFRKWMEWTPQERQADYLSGLLTQTPWAKEVRLFNLGGPFQRRFQHLRQQIRQDKLRLAAAHAIANWVIQASSTIAVFGAWAFMAAQTLKGNISLGSLVMYYQAFQQGQSLLSQVLNSLSALYENSLFLANFYGFLQLRSSLTEPDQPLPIPQPLKQGIEFERVHFSYPHSPRSVLNGVSFQIRAGETVALVGANGAGKTSLIKLLCRLYDPTQGRILLDGVDLRQFASDQLRQHISVVFQDYAHYNLTVQENIAVGNGLLNPEPEQILQAAQMAGAEALIARLPAGYETILGTQFAEGVELSIGEWQKLAIARAFLHSAQIMVLDEPTSALDAEAEFEVLAQFRHLTRDRTALLISHRFSSIKLADRILVLENGVISESGTHDQLMQQRGSYYQMFETQAQQYR
jgi:ATP-binding cassette, subfamily B, bacterial